MDKEMKAALDEFRAALVGVNAGLPDFLQLLSGLVEAHAISMAYALMNHMRDITSAMPQGTQTDYPDLIAESYSRTFCEPEHIAKYGGNAKGLSESDVPGFLRAVASGLRQLAESSNPEQFALTLDANTDQAH